MVSGDVVVVKWDDTPDEVGIYVDVHDMDEDDVVRSVNVLFLHGCESVEMDQLVPMPKTFDSRNVFTKLGVV